MVRKSASVRSPDKKRNRLPRGRSGQAYWNEAELLRVKDMPATRQSILGRRIALCVVALLLLFLGLQSALF